MLRFTHLRTWRACYHFRTAKRHALQVVQSTSDGGGDGFAAIKKARQKQLKASDLLARLLQASDAKVEAKLHVDSLTEEFFQMSSAYMQMAQQEGNQEVYGQMKAALMAAMEVKQSTLRPEIQLLNKLLAEDDDSSWIKVLDSKDSRQQLVQNDGYFFQLLDGMITDVSRQPEHPKKQELESKLSAIRKVAKSKQSAQS